MTENRLNIINVTSSPNSSAFEQPQRVSLTTRIKEMRAKFERLWLIDPEQFNPLRNCMQQERLERTWDLLTKHTNLVNQHAVDIGCGAGVFSRRLRDAGAQVEAVDIAENALKKFKEIDAENILLTQSAMPLTTLPDHSYDIIICTELIAEIAAEDYRLFFAELSRIIKPTGYLVCSTAIDIDSVGGIERLNELAQTEFDLVDALFSYHSLYLRLKRFFEAPSQFIKGWQNREFKRKELASRRGFNRWWFWLNTSPLLIWLWYIFDPLIKPINQSLKNNTWILQRLEKICHFMSDQDGISHYLFIAKQRPLNMSKAEQHPIEKPRRKEIWD